MDNAKEVAAPARRLALDLFFAFFQPHLCPVRKGAKIRLGELDAPPTSSKRNPHRGLDKMHQTVIDYYIWKEPLEQTLTWSISQKLVGYWGLAM